MKLDVRETYNGKKVRPPGKGPMPGALLARTWCRSLKRFWHERGATVAIISSLAMPAFFGAVGFGVEASNWSVLETELQRTADLAAYGAAIVYQSTSDAYGAANASADVSELNGLPARTRSWYSDTKTLTDGLMTVQLATGIKNPDDIAFLVTVQKAVSLFFPRVFVNAASYNITAQSTVELLKKSTAQPCLLGLAGYKTSDTTITAVSNSGSIAVSASNCSIRSNGVFNAARGANLSAAAIYAGGAITAANNTTVQAVLYPNSGQIPDPYSDVNSVQTALASLGSCSACPAVKVRGSNNQTIGPGTYSGISVSGNLTLQAGLYVVDGDVMVTGSGGITGSGVTIVTNGNVSLSGSRVTSLTAPGASPVGGAIPGIAIAGTTSSNTTLSGGPNLIINGVVYFPNSNMNFSGSWSDPNSPCLEVIANQISLTGNSNLSGRCASYGAKSFSGLSTTTATLVQ